MPLRPDDVIRTTFDSSRLRRGYDEKQVDAFMEEVVLELRRLYSRIDEVEAEAARLSARTEAEDTSERVQREQQQVDLIRAERRDLVTELAGVQARLDTCVREAEAADARATNARAVADDAEARAESAAAGLREAEARLLRVQAEYDEMIAARERAGSELRTLRVAAEERAASALPDVRLPEGSTEDDLDAILTVARALHDDYVESARREAETIRDQAVHDTSVQRDEARADVERLVNRASEQSRVLLEQAQAERDRLVLEAETERAGILADLQARREVLERRIVELDEQQGAYRDRLRTLVQQQLAALDDEEWRLGPTTGSEAHAPALP